MSWFVWALLVGSFLTNAGYGVVLPAMPSLVAHSSGTDAWFGLSALSNAVAVGLTYSVFSASKTVALLCGGVWSDTSGARAILCGSLMLYAVSLFGLTVAPDLTTLLFWRTIEGIAVGLSYPAGASLLLRDDQAEFTKNNAMVIVAGGMGLVTGPVLVMAAGMPQAPNMMRVMAVATVLSAVAIFVSTAAHAGAFTSQPRFTLKQTLAELAKHLCSLPFLALLAPLGFGKMTFSVLQPLLPIYASTHGQDERFTGVLFAATGIVFALFQPVAVAACKRFGHRSTVSLATTGAAVSVFCLALGDLMLGAVKSSLLAPHLWFALMYLMYVVFGSMLFASLLGYIAEQAGLVDQPQATIFGTAHAITDVGMFVAPPLLLGLYDVHAPSAFWVLAGLGACAAFAFRYGRMPSAH